MAWLDSRNATTPPGLARRIRAAVRHLRARDPVVAGLIARFGVYDLQTTRNHFQVMLETVISQQLSTRAAASIYRRLSEALCAGRTPRPRDVLDAGDGVLRRAGLSRAKVRYVRSLAETFASGRARPSALARASDGEVMRRLMAIDGVGEWSAHMFLIFALARLDVFPAGDLGLRKAMAAQYGLRGTPSAARLAHIAARWRPYRTVGTLYLWQSYNGV
jgi:DNA-3-methyladenine glycosylase II